MKRKLKLEMKNESWNSKWNSKWKVKLETKWNSKWNLKLEAKNETRNEKWNSERNVKLEMETETRNDMWNSKINVKLTIIILLEQSRCVSLTSFPASDHPPPRRLSKVLALNFSLLYRFNCPQNFKDKSSEKSLTGKISQRTVTQIIL